MTVAAAAADVIAWLVGVIVCTVQSNRSIIHKSAISLVSFIITIFLLFG